MGRDTRQQQQKNPAPPAKGPTTPEKRLGAHDLARPMPLAELRKVVGSPAIVQEFIRCFPKTISLEPNHFLRVALRTISGSSDLMSCTARSLIYAMMEAATLGLELDGILGHAYLVPYKQTATMLIGYRGFIVLAQRSGQVYRVDAHEVYEWDECDVDLTGEGHIRHRPRRPPPDLFKQIAEEARKRDGSGRLSGRPDLLVQPHVIGAYGLWHYTDRTRKPKPHWMWREQIDLVRERSRAATNGPWVTDYVAMAVKTPIRAGSKLLGLSPELTKAAAHDERVEFGLDDVDELVEGGALAQAGSVERLNDLANRYPKAADDADKARDAGAETKTGDGGTKTADDETKPAGDGTQGALIPGVQGAGGREPGAEG